MPINPNIHLTKADVVRVRMEDMSEAADYAASIAEIGIAQSQVVQSVDEVAGTLQHQFAHIHEELADTEPMVDRTAENVVTMTDYAHLRPANNSSYAQNATVTGLDSARKGVEDAIAREEHMGFEEMLKAAQERPAA